nr:SDR family NAD(P)-dependent oxidoreductase [Enterovibrio nigricans]
MEQETIVITGAGQRIGFALAKHFNAQGFSVVVSYRTERQGVAELKAMGVECIPADFGSDKGIHQFSRLSPRNTTQFVPLSTTRLTGTVKKTPMTMRHCWIR